MKSQPPLLIHALTNYQRLWQNSCLEGKTDNETSEYSLRSKSIVQTGHFKLSGPQEVRCQKYATIMTARTWNNGQFEWIDVMF